MARKTSSGQSDRDGSMAFSEFSSTEPAATRKFLEKVFGWQFESVKFPMGEYLSFRTPGGGKESRAGGWRDCPSARGRPGHGELLLVPRARRSDPRGMARRSRAADGA